MIASKPIRQHHGVAYDHVLVMAEPVEVSFL
jgi:hypothetical protein